MSSSTSEDSSPSSAQPHQHGGSGSLMDISDTPKYTLTENDRSGQEGLSDLEDEDLSDPPDPNRPNRRKVSRTDWLTKIAEERQLNASLESLRARELGIHLYNAYKLRQRARELRAGRLAKEAALIWGPLEYWTKWPMPSRRVPRELLPEGEDEDEDEDSLRSHRTARSSRQLLEEILVSLSAKSARSRFEQRSWEDEQTTKLQTNRDYEEQAQALSGTGFRPSGDQRQVRSAPRMAQQEFEAWRWKQLQAGFPTFQTADINNMPESDANGLFGVMQLEDGRLVETEEDEREGARNLMFLDPPKHTFKVETSYLRPSPMIDEDHIQSLLQRPTRHTLALFDGLLGALHYSRVSYQSSKPSRKPRKPKRPKKAPCNILDQDNLSNPANGGAHQADQAGRPGDFSLDDVEGANSEPHDASTSISSSDAPVEMSRPRKRRRTSTAAPVQNAQSCEHPPHPSWLSPRDWSDVLGFAALTGWPASAVQRARARCERLFEQRMDFVGSKVEGEDWSSSDEELDTDQAIPSPSTVKREVPEIDRGFLQAASAERSDVEMGHPPQRGPPVRRKVLMRPKGIQYKTTEQRVRELLDGVHRDGFLEPLRIPVYNDPQLTKESRMASKETSEDVGVAVTTMGAEGTQLGDSDEMSASSDTTDNLGTELDPNFDSGTIDLATEHEVDTDEDSSVDDNDIHETGHEAGLSIVSASDGDLDDSDESTDGSNSTGGSSEMEE